MLARRLQHVLVLTDDLDACRTEAFDELVVPVCLERDVVHR